MAPLFHFFAIASREAVALNERRRYFALKHGPAYSNLSEVDVAAMRDSEGPVKDERGHDFPLMTSQQEIVGLSLSGGGIRSAAFCLGVLQGMDAVVPDNEQPQLLDAVDYLSTVSGGGYIGCSLAAGLRLNKGKFPFTSKLDQMETIGTQHLRDYSNYLAPNGMFDWVVGAVAVTRGLLINAFLVFGLVLLAAFATVSIFPTEHLLHGASLGTKPGAVAAYAPRALAFAVLCIVAGSVTLTATSLDRRPGRRAQRLSDRERLGTILAVTLTVLAGLGVLALQPVVLAGLFDAVHLSLCSDYASQSGWLGRRLHAIGLGSGAPWKTLTTLTAALWAFGGKFVKIASATFGDQSWSGFLAHWASRIAILIGAAALPVAIWAVYLSFSYAAIAWTPWTGSAACCWHPGPPPLPLWMNAVGVAPGEVPLIYGLLGLFLTALSFLTTPNANSLHGYYRDRLSRAFLWSEASLKAEAENREKTRPSFRQAILGLRRRPMDDDAADRLKLSDLRPQNSGQASDGAVAPYLLVNAAVNLEGSKYANRRGRNADSFIFSTLHSGSEATGYVATADLEQADPHLDLATSMAISGAAASANMGASTIKPLTFSLALLNVRLGYWLPNPRRLDGSRSRTGGLDQVWPLYFGMEALGLLDEWSRNVYLTDGGHFDNLGLYELLKRRCKIIIAADAEADPAMNFESLIRLERCARIDLGVRVDLPWEELRRWSLGITVDKPHGPADDLKACIGPHVALGRIQYTDEDFGVLIYIKSCISGDENDLIRDYRRRNPTFPHETTLDQFLTEEQFEVYRALGFHATKSFFSGQDRFGFSPSHASAAWTELVRRALTRLNIPEDAVGRIVAQQTPKPPTAETQSRPWLEGFAGSSRS